jgi:hypothetical protein
MRAVLIAAVMAAGIGLAGTTAGAATPLNGTVIHAAAHFNNSIDQVHWRGGHRWWWWRHHHRHHRWWR